MHLVHMHIMISHCRLYPGVGEKELLENLCLRLYFYARDVKIVREDLNVFYR